MNNISTIAANVDPKTEPATKSALASKTETATVTAIDDMIERYKQQISFTYNPTMNDYNVETCFDAAVAIMTNTVLYNDLPLDDVNTFEESINWENECTDADFHKPFISHVNLETKTFISSFMANDEEQLANSWRGMMIMADVASRYGYTYIVAMSEPIPQIMRTCQRLHIDEQYVIVVDSNTIKTITYCSSMCRR